MRGKVKKRRSHQELVEEGIEEVKVVDFKGSIQSANKDTEMDVENRIN